VKQGDTIVAISSSAGAAARMIVRVSGPGVAAVITRLCPAAPCAPSATRGMLRFAGLECPAWVYRFAAPRSYTGEDLVEFHLPGNPVLARMLLDELSAAGARPAEAGEFTARAYFNGRIDLTEAEGVAATIAAHSERELSAARQLAAGELSRRLRPMMEMVAETLALVEVGIDFTEEDVTFLSRAEVVGRVERATEALAELVRQSARFERLAHEPQVVLVGRPNAGKSTLLNALAGYERAVVSAVAGTTRDVLSVEVVLACGMVRLIDAAGVDEEAAEAGEAPEVSRQMRRRALAALEEADQVVLVREVGDDRPPLQLPRAADLVVRTKADLAADREEGLPGECVLVSAVTGLNVDVLRARLDALCFGGGGASATLALNGRHLQAVGEATAALDRARAAAEEERGVEIVALELREALDALGRILGSVTPDDLLGRIFGAFCIGK
jgi:tRNA modification GTPase